MRFQFRLDPVLRLRQRDEDVAAREVAAMERRRTDLEDRIRDCQSAIRGGKDRVRDGLIGSVDVSALRGEAAGSIGAMQRAQAFVRELVTVHQELEGARARLRDAARARRAIELLRERRYESWCREERRSEQRELDEIAARSTSA